MFKGTCASSRANQILSWLPEGGGGEGSLEPYEPRIAKGRLSILGKKASGTWSHTEESRTKEWVDRNRVLAKTREPLDPALPEVGPLPAFKTFSQQMRLPAKVHLSWAPVT